MPVQVIASARAPVVAKTAKTVAPKAINKNNAKVALASAAATAAVALAPAAQAAQEIAMTAEGEPAIVQVAWAALAASFSFSLATTVWGRAGL
eukprot:GFKZ01004681.1.p1 GENE.GFKZ01004681.1~~GFKZ01004681.1.p1  ORF type:complete len:107 (-),score=13.23 GFKZ01004681.1:135-413(-)